MRVVCRGPKIQIFLNGEQTVDYTETDDVDPAPRRDRAADPQWRAKRSLVPQHSHPPALVASERAGSE